MERIELCMDVVEGDSDYESYKSVLDLFQGDFGQALEHGVALTLWILSQLNQDRKILCHDMTTGKCLPVELDTVFSLSRTRHEKFRKQDYDLGSPLVADIDVDQNMIVLGFTLRERLYEDFYKIMRCLLVRKEAKVVDTVVSFVHQHALLTAEKQRLISARVVRKDNYKLAEAIPVWT